MNQTTISDSLGVAADFKVPADQPVDMTLLSESKRREFRASQRAVVCTTELEKVSRDRDDAAKQLATVEALLEQERLSVESETEMRIAVLREVAAAKLTGHREVVNAARGRHDLAEMRLAAVSSKLEAARLELVGLAKENGHSDDAYEGKHWDARAAVRALKIYHEAAKLTREKAGGPDASEARAS